MTSILWQMWMYKIHDIVNETIICVKSATEIRHHEADFGDKFDFDFSVNSSGGK